MYILYIQESKKGPLSFDSFAIACLIQVTCFKNFIA